VLAVPGGDAHPNYTGWAFTSLFNWGEESLGDWTVTVSDEMANNQGKVSSWSVVPIAKQPLILFCHRCVARVRPHSVRTLGLRTRWLLLCTVQIKEY
jgi:hypothetical protein